MLKYFQAMEKASSRVFKTYVNIGTMNKEIQKPLPELAEEMLDQGQQTKVIVEEEESEEKGNMPRSEQKPGQRQETQTRLELSNPDAESARDFAESVASYGGSKKNTAEAVRKRYPEEGGLFAFVANLFKGRK